MKLFVSMLLILATLMGFADAVLLLSGHQHDIIIQGSRVLSNDVKMFKEEMKKEQVEKDKYQGFLVLLLSIGSAYGLLLHSKNSQNSR